MSVALRLAVGALALAAVFVLPVVLAAKGYFDPPQDRAAYEERVALARAYLAPAEKRFFGPNSQARRGMAASIANLEQDFPEVLHAHPAEVDALYAAWLEAIVEFSTSAHAHWFAARFSARDIRARFERKGGWLPAGIRRFLVFRLHKGELDIIKERTKLLTICFMMEEVLPALVRLGAESLSAGEEVRESCRDAEADGWFDPARPLH